MNKNLKSRVFTLMLYPNEDESHKNALEYIKEHFKYAYITHDKDIDEETKELKKPHVHCVIQFPNVRSLNSLSDDLKIEPNYIKKVSDLDSILLYLIHYYEDDKYKYSVDEVKGVLKSKLQVLINKEKIIDINEAMCQIQEYINNSGDIRIKDFVSFACYMGLFGYYRQSASIVHRLIDEHNFDIKKERGEYEIKENESDIYRVNLDTGELTPYDDGKKEIMKL